ncbi:hypothetical protein, conserved [Leishmania tarentolae]|uniref:Uncharacterized protein n=1 Tax=Leishmania tarentolae TaxID=5689 RepID=A0A640K9N8_LEITA|nr:hypothetical protein, conserved [Leishmania tarentolae]
MGGMTGTLPLKEGMSTPPHPPRQREREPCLSFVALQRLLMSGTSIAIECFVTLRESIVNRRCQAELSRSPTFSLDVFLDGRVAPIPLLLLAEVHCTVDAQSGEGASNDQVLLACPLKADEVRHSRVGPDVALHV